MLCSCDPVIQPNEYSTWLRKIISILILTEIFTGILIIFGQDISFKGVFIFDDIINILILYLAYLTFAYFYCSLYIICKISTLCFLLISFLMCILKWSLQDHLYSFIAILLHGINDILTFVIVYLSNKEFKAQFFDAQANQAELSIIVEDDIYPPQMYRSNLEDQMQAQNLMNNNNNDDRRQDNNRRDNNFGNNRREEKKQNRPRFPGQGVRIQ